MNNDIKNRLISAPRASRLSNRVALRNLSWVLLLATSLLATMSRSATAQSRALSVEEMIRAREFAPGSRIQFSPDGKRLAYTVTRSHAEPDHRTDGTTIPFFGRGADIYVADTVTGAQKTVTGEVFDNWWPACSPDSEHLAFLSDRDGSGSTKIWIWNARDESLRKLSDKPAELGPIEWTPDGHQVIFSRAIGSVSAAHSHDASKVAIPASGPTVTVYKPSANSNSDAWSLARYSMALELVDVDTGDETNTIVQGQIGTYRLSPDGSHLAFTIARRFAEAGSQQILFDFEIADIKSGESHKSMSDVPLNSDGSGFSWSPDGNYLCLRSSDGQGTKYFVVSASGGVLPRLMEHTFPSDLTYRTAPLWNQSASRFYFLEQGELWSGDVVTGQIDKVAGVAGRQIKQIIPCRDDVVCIVDQSSVLVVTRDNDGKQDGVYAANLGTGQSRPLLEQGQCYSCVLAEPSLAISPDGQRIAYVKEDASDSPDLWLSDVGFQSRRQLTHLNPQFDPRFMGRARLIDWLSDDGERLKGALLLPSNYQPGKHYPLVTYVYGGALQSNRLDTFGLAQTGPLNMQLFATRGYAAFLPDMPQRDGTPMLSLAKTVLPGINKVIEMGIADPDRLAVIGHSYGGYSVLSLIVQTVRFKAAIAMAGYGDLLGIYGEMLADGSSFGITVTEQRPSGIGGTPWDHRQGFIENSPFFYYDRIETPVLIIHGDDDPTVASFLSDQMFVALRRLGKDVEYARYTGEGHSPAQEWSYSNQLDFGTRVLLWLDTHLNPPSSRAGN
jgi:dipeptidyl aminopeptidase/acylaminoacyl peptidase